VPNLPLGLPLTRSVRRVRIRETRARSARGVNRNYAAARVRGALRIGTCNLREEQGKNRINSKVDPDFRMRTRATDRLLGEGCEPAADLGVAGNTSPRVH